MVRDGGGLVRVWIASVGGEPVSAALVLRGHVAHYTRGAMDEEKVGQTYANYLLHARAIEDACAAGCGHYHMGETGNSESLAAFKSRFGAVAVPYAEYRHERIPLLSAAAAARGVVKKAIGFKDV
jgi:lipid II:glycine glycyltransferase (peptidoglycan interpeptide bridge formation enzyme)